MQGHQQCRDAHMNPLDSVWIFALSDAHFCPSTPYSQGKNNRYSYH